MWSGGMVLLKGNASCQGCPHSIAFKTLNYLENPIVLMPAGCSTVIAGLHPNSSLEIPCVHVPFPATPAVSYGLSTGLKKRGIKANVVAWMGDGSVDISYSLLAGSALRNDDIIIIVVDNEAYMNTGVQSSGTTFWKAKTTTSPKGKREERRDVALQMALHRVPYVATASIGYMRDFIKKVKKAGKVEGFRFIHVHCPCPPGWGFESSKTVEIARKAIQCRAWILWEYENKKFRISRISKKAKGDGLKDYLLSQARLRHLSDEDIEEIRRRIEEEWKLLEHLEKL